MADKIEPALTAEEWPDVLDSTDDNGAASGDVATFAMRGRFAAAAAVALYRQPFGFTREDVAALVKWAQEWEREERYDIEDSRPLDADEMAVRARSLAARIAALLPPEG